MTASVSQPLLRGLTFDAPRAARALAVKGRDLADSVLAASVAGVVREVTHAYWQWEYARELLAIEENARRLAQVLRDGNRARVAAGALAAVDVVEAEAEVARREEAIIIAAKNVANAEDRLRMLIAADGHRRMNDPFEPDVQLDASAPAPAPGRRPTSWCGRSRPVRTCRRSVWQSRWTASRCDSTGRMRCQTRR